MAPLSEKPVARRYHTIMYTFLVAIVVGGLAWQYQEVEAQCAEARLNREAIREQILGSFESVGYRYDPETESLIETGSELAYYREHPDEREDQAQDLIVAIERFPPVQC